MTNQPKILTDEEIDKLEDSLSKDYTLYTLPYYGVRLLETIATIRQLKNKVIELEGSHCANCGIETEDDCFGI